MTGPEHYKEAERLLAAVFGKGAQTPALFDVWLKAAQVHATLALTAATKPAPAQTCHCMDVIG